MELTGDRVCGRSGLSHGVYCGRPNAQTRGVDAEKRLRTIFDAGSKGQYVADISR